LFNKISFFSAVKYCGLVWRKFVSEIGLSTTLFFVGILLGYKSYHGVLYVSMLTCRLHCRSRVDREDN